MSSDVMLIFPPLVESNFGSLYPAPAVLAAYMHAHGIDSSQEDLNETFAEFLLSSRVLQAAGAGTVPGVTPDSMFAAAARWISGHRPLLIDDGGRHHFGRNTDYGYLLEILAQPFLIDPDAVALGPLDSGRPLLPWYEEFFAWSRVADRLEENVGLAGICAAMGPQLLPALALADHLKRARPDLRVVLGGATLSLMDPADINKLLRSHPAVDCVVRFDGEVPLLELARQVAAGQWQPESVPGVSSRSGGTVTHQPPGPGPDLNKLPEPRYPRAAIERLAEPTLSITQARGCYWGKCDYCDFVELYAGSAPFRGRHPDNFTAEIERLVAEFGVRSFNFVTESIPPAFARKVSELFLARGLDITWNSFAMVDRRFDRDLLALMVRAGCEFLVIGLETMNTRVLKLVHKSADEAENIRFLRDARSVGMRLRINLIPDLPSTTFTESVATLDAVSELADCFESVSVFPFEATRSSNVGRYPERFQLLPLASTGSGGQSQYAQSQYALNHFSNADPAMTPQERAEVHQRYRQFASQVAARTPPDHGAVPSASYSGPVTVSAQVDVFDTGDTLICTHMGTRERLTLHPGLADALRRCAGDRAVTVADLGEATARKLLAARVLVPSPDGADGR